MAQWVSTVAFFFWRLCLTSWLSLQMKASWVVSSQSPFVHITKPPGNLAWPGVAAWERSGI